jgi:hypothetical protein
VRSNTNATATATYGNRDLLCWLFMIMVCLSSLVTPVGSSSG